MPQGTVYVHMIGVNVLQTASLDLIFDAAISNGAFAWNYGYLGCPSPGSTPQSYFTFNTGSRNTTSLRNFQMYTPYPTNTTRGKLYWLSSDQLSVASLGTISSSFVSVATPAPDYYYVVTPSLEDPTLQTSNHIVQYSFTDENDLYQNGWKVLDGKSGSADPLISPGVWNQLINAPVWTNPSPAGFGLSLVTPGDKAKIVASILSYSSASADLQTFYSVAPSDIVKGALVIGGENTPFDNSNNKGFVPIVGVPPFNIP